MLFFCVCGGCSCFISRQSSFSHSIISLLRRPPLNLCCCFRWLLYTNTINNFVVFVPVSVFFGAELFHRFITYHSEEFYSILLLYRFGCILYFYSMPHFFSFYFVFLHHFLFLSTYELLQQSVKLLYFSTSHFFLFCSPI